MVLKVGKQYKLKTKNLENIPVYIESMDEEYIYLNDLDKMGFKYVSADYILEKNTNNYKLGKMSNMTKMTKMSKMTTIPEVPDIEKLSM